MATYKTESIPVNHVEQGFELAIQTDTDPNAPLTPFRVDDITHNKAAGQQSKFTLTGRLLPSDKEWTINCHNGQLVTRITGVEDDGIESDDTSK
jgi:hypothetical protein